MQPDAGSGMRKNLMKKTFTKLGKLFPSLFSMPEKVFVLDPLASAAAAASATCSQGGCLTRDLLVGR